MKDVPSELYAERVYSHILLYLQNLLYYKVVATESADKFQWAFQRHFRGINNNTYTFGILCH